MDRYKELHANVDALGRIIEEMQRLEVYARGLQLKVATEHIAVLPLECDGKTRLAHLALLRAEVPHKCMSGVVFFGEQVIELHFWIESGPFVVDYHLKPWLGGDLPCGVFVPGDTPDLIYQGFETQFSISSCVALEASLST